MLNEDQLRLISEATLRKTADIGLRHAQGNCKYIKKTIKDLKAELKGSQERPSLVVSAGPSLHRRKSIATIKNSQYDGYIIAADGALGHCLRNGLVPDFVVTVDPHPHRIIRWFGDPRLRERPDDDYFRRQDLDPALHQDEVRKNDEMINLVNRYGKRIKVLISTSVTPEITRRCLDAGMELYWWNPIYDDVETPESITRRVYELTNRVPCMVTGGNVGTSAWVAAHTVLKSRNVLMVGMDFSYPPNTSLINTQYYEVLKELMPDNPDAGIIRVYNPHLQETWLTDPAYYWYCQNFLQIVRMTDCRTYNCTEGGILFGEGIQFAPLEETLGRFAGSQKRAS